MAQAGGKDNPYGVDSDPMRGQKNPLQSAPVPADQAAANLKRKQKASIEEEFDQEDPIGNAVRSLWQKVRG